MIKMIVLIKRVLKHVNIMSLGIIKVIILIHKQNVYQVFKRLKSLNLLSVLYAGHIGLSLSNVYMNLYDVVFVQNMVLHA